MLSAECSKIHNSSFIDIMSALQFLHQIAAPPKVPVEAQGDWKQVEATLGLTLPDDYKQLISLYGSGRFSDFLYTFNPFAEHKELNLVNSSQEILAGARSLTKNYPEEFPFPLFPELDGLFPCGCTDYGNYLYWYTKGKPQDWAIVVWESRGLLHEVYQMSVVEFLGKWLARELNSTVFPKMNEYFPVAIFEQYRKLEHISVFFDYVELPYQQRLERIWNYFGCGKLKGRYLDENCSQTHFLINQLDAESTYWDNMNYGSILRLAYPQEREYQLRKKVLALSIDLGLPIKQILDYNGNLVWK